MFSTTLTETYLGSIRTKYPKILEPGSRITSFFKKKITNLFWVFNIKKNFINKIPINTSCSYVTFTYPLVFDLIYPLVSTLLIVIFYSFVKMFYDESNKKLFGRQNQPYRRIIFISHEIRLRNTLIILGQRVTRSGFLCRIKKCENNHSRLNLFPRREIGHQKTNWLNKIWNKTMGFSNVLDTHVSTFFRP